MKYRTIVADPPWHVSAGPAHYADNPRRADTGPRSRSLAYPTLTVSEIAALDVPAEDDAHLYLWTINRYIEAAYLIARA